MFFLMSRAPPRTKRTGTLFPYSTRFRTAGSRRFRAPGERGGAGSQKLTGHRELLSPEPVIPSARVVHAFTASLYTVAMDETADYTLEIQIATRFLDEESEPDDDRYVFRSEEHTSELQSLMRRSYSVFCWHK